MDEKLFNELESNLKEAVNIAKGRVTPKTAYIALTPAGIKAIRLKVKMSQATFARAFHLSLDTLKGWEQGKRTPDAAATNYLHLIQADPDFVQEVFRGHAQKGSGCTLHTVGRAPKEYDESVQGAT